MAETDVLPTLREEIAMAIWRVPTDRWQTCIETADRIISAVDRARAEAVRDAASNLEQVASIRGLPGDNTADGDQAVIAARTELLRIAGAEKEQGA